MMLVPPLMYIGAITSRNDANGVVKMICIVLPLPCAFYLIHAVFQPKIYRQRFIRRNRISSFEEKESPRLDAILESSTSGGSAESDIPNQEPLEDQTEAEAALPISLSFGKAALSALGRAPTLVLEDHDDTARESNKLPKAALASLSHAPTLILEDDTDEEFASSGDPSDDGQIEREEVDPTVAAPVRRRATRWQRKSAVDKSGPIAEGLESSRLLRKQNSAEVNTKASASDQILSP